METILKVLVGSQAHGLATPESDNDYRGVFVAPTSDILSLTPSSPQTQWIEGKEDDTSWELQRFLFLATKCNPTILEVFKAPAVISTPEGTTLRQLFPYIWNSKGVMDAFIGYGLNQRKKFLDDKDKRRAKYATAYVRSLFNAWQLLSTGTFDVDIRHTEIYETCRKFRRGDFTTGEVVNTCEEWEAKVRAAYAENPHHEANLEPVKDFLLEVRWNHWQAA